MPAPTYALAVDLDRDELFATAQTGDVVSEGGGPGELLCEYTRGHDLARVLSQPRAGSGGFLLDNNDGTYSIGTTLAAGQQVRLRGTYGGTTYDLVRAILDQPVQTPIGTGRTLVRCPLLGPLSRLAGKQISTALYTSITTGVAVGHLLDAAGYSKNAQPYITGLAPSGQWGLGEAAGTETDLSGNGNDATVTYAAGQRGAAALDDGGDGATTFEEGTTNKVTTPYPGAVATDGVTFTPNAGGSLTLEDNDGAPFESASGKVWRLADSSGATGTIVAFDGTVGNVNTHSISIWARIETGTTGARIECSGGEGQVAITSESWTRIESPNITPGAATRKMQVSFSGGGTGAVRFVMGQLEEKPDVTSACHGSLGTGYSWSGTENASTSTRVATKMVVTDAAAIQNLFDGGGGVAVLCNITSDGQSDTGRLIDKAAWYLNVQNESGGNVRLNFRVGFSGTEGIWQSAVNIPLATDLAIVLAYNADDVANNPTIYVIDLSTGVATTLTVGSGLTETSTPVGTRTTDVGSDLIGGNNAAGTLTAAGVVDEPAVFSTLPTLAQVMAWAARCIDAPRHLDEGKTTLDWWWLDKQDAMGALNTLKATEGPGAAVYEDGTGAITFKGRHARLTETRSTTIQTTFRTAAGAAEPLASLPFAYDPGTRDVVNQATVDVNVRTLAALAQVWALGSTVVLGVNETRKYVARQSDGDPFTAAVAPDSGGGDYTVSVGALASVPTIDRTSGSSVTITLVGGAAGATVTGLRLRAQSLDVTSTTTVASTIDVTASQTAYGVRTFPLPIRADISVSVAQDLVNAIVGYQQDGRATATVTVRGIQSAERLTAALAREVSDRVRIVHAGSGLDADFYVEHIAFEVRAPASHVTAFACEETGAATFFVLDTSTLDGGDVIGF